MLLTAIVYSLPMALGVALSPLPIAAVVTILLSVRPANAPAFLLGWITGILVIGGIVFLIPGLDTARGEPTLLSGWIKLGLGGVLLVLAVWQWQQRPSADDPVEAPKVLSKLDSLSAARTVVMGFLLSAFNPKNLVLTFAGAAAIDASMATPSQQAIALTLYAVVASLSIIIPIIGYTLFTERVETVLTDWKDWLIRNNAIMVTAVLAAFGALIVGSGLLILSA
jgi:hypothetical protein